MSNRNKAKGSKYEGELADLLTDMGYASQRIPLSGAAGGMFSDDILVEFAPGLTVKVESKYRSKPEKDGLGAKLLKLILEVKERHPDEPLCVSVGRLHVRELTEFPQLNSTPRSWAHLDKPTAVLQSWIDQASSAGLPVVCIRLPHRVWRHKNKWLIVTDASSQAHLNLLSSMRSQMLSIGKASSAASPGTSSSKAGRKSPYTSSTSKRVTRKSAPKGKSTSSKPAKRSLSTDK